MAVITLRHQAAQTKTQVDRLAVDADAFRLRVTAGSRDSVALQNWREARARYVRAAASLQVLQQNIDLLVVSLTTRLTAETLRNALPSMRRLGDGGKDTNAAFDMMTEEVKTMDARAVRLARDAQRREDRAASPAALTPEEELLLRHSSPV